MKKMALIMVGKGKEWNGRSEVETVLKLMILPSISVSSWASSTAIA